MSDYKPISYDFDAFKKLMLFDVAAQKDFEVLSDEFLLISEMLRARKKANKTQKEVADIMQTTSSAISRLESLQAQQKHAITLKTLRKYADAVGCSLSIKFIPISQRAENKAI